MVTIKSLLQQCEGAISSINTENPHYEAIELIKKATGISQLIMLTEPECTVQQELAEQALEMAKRRSKGEPLQYILGEWEFYGMTFEVGEGVLIPRQDTETLVELALEHINSGMLCADLCSGSGCIGIAVSTADCRVICYERSPQAMEYLQRNIESNGVSDKVSAVMADVLDDGIIADAPMFDVILSNPPYLTKDDMDSLQTEVRYEPEMALYGGDDGLHFYREIVRLWAPKLKSGGLLAVEIGIGQEKDVCDIFSEHGIKAEMKRDLCGVYRVIYGIKP